MTSSGTHNTSLRLQLNVTFTLLELERFLFVSGWFMDGSMTKEIYTKLSTVASFFLPVVRVSKIPITI